MSAASSADGGSFETSAIICAAFVGALGWDAAYRLPHDLQLLFSKAWLRSPIRILSRLSYMLSRYCALASLMFNINYWYYPHSNDSICERLPYVIESLMSFSYANTLIILMLRTIALYPTTKKRDWIVFYVILTIFLVNVALAIWLPFNVRGSRIPSDPTRCVFTQANGDTALRAFLISAVFFDSEKARQVTVLALTVFKLFSSGTYLFYSRKTIIGRHLRRDDGPTMEKESALTQLAAELIGQGLYDFAAITVVGCGALISYFTISVVAYQALTINCIAAISAALAGGVFRETARAARTMKAVHEQEQKMRAVLAQRDSSPSHMHWYANYEKDQNESQDWQRYTRCSRMDESGVGRYDLKDSSIRSTSAQSMYPKPPLVEELAMDFACHGNHSPMEEIKEGNRRDERIDLEEQSHSSHQSRNSSKVEVVPNPLHRANTPEAVVNFDRYLPFSSHQIINNRAEQKNRFLPLEMSLRAFDDGSDSVVESRSAAKETLGVVSIIGGEPIKYSLENVRRNNESFRGLSPPPRSHNRAQTIRRK